MIGSLCSLKVKAPGSGKWDVFLALQRTLTAAKRVLFTSAQADVAAKELCQCSDLVPHYQMNTESFLSHLCYELCHYDSSEIGYQRIFDALQDDKKIALPCSEQKDLEAILEHIASRLPQKTILRIDGTVQGLARAQAMLDAQTTVFDVL